jgi:hypothetical protein
MISIEHLSADHLFNFHDWDIQGPIRGVGKYKKRLKKSLDQQYPPVVGEAGEAIPQYEIGHYLEISSNDDLDSSSGFLLTTEGFRKYIYLESYLSFLQELEWPALILASLAQDVFEWEERDIESGIDPMIQKGGRTHLQDIAIRYAIEQMGVQWDKDQDLVCVNAFDVEGSEGDRIPMETDFFIEHLYAGEPKEIRQTLKEVARVVSGDLWFNLLNPAVVPGPRNVRPYDSQEIPINQQLGMREFGSEWFETQGGGEDKGYYTVEELLQKSRYLLTRRRDNI